MKLQFFALDLDYFTEQEKTFILLYGKTPKGEQVCVKEEFQPYCYLATKGVDTKKLQKALQDFSCSIKEKGQTKELTGKILSWEEEKKVLFTQEQTFWKLYLNHPATIFGLLKHFKGKGLTFYEADIPVTRQYLRDKEITPTLLLEAQGEFEKETDSSKDQKKDQRKCKTFLSQKTKLAKNDQKKDQHFTENIKILGFDIETYNKERAIDMQKNAILMIAVHGEEKTKTGRTKKFEKVLSWKKFKTEHKYIEFQKTEAEMLERFAKLVNEFNPDLITGYFSDAFDLPYIKKRAEMHKVSLPIALDNSDIKIKKRAHLSNGAATITGRPHIDTFKFVRNIFGKDWKIESYSLDNVSSLLLNEKKVEVNIAGLADAWDQKKDEELSNFAKYNLKDAYLSHKICEQLIVPMFEFCRLLDITLNDMIRMKFSKLVESYLLKREDEFNLINPNKPPERVIRERMGISVQGAFVFEPKPDFYKNVVVFDFLSLYPTIIVSHNVARESLHKERKRGSVQVPEHKLWIDPKQTALIPKVLGDIIEMRVQLKKERKRKAAKKEDTTLIDSRLYALKVLANSFYGYLGFYGARWYSKDAARSVTAYARYYIKDVIKEAEAAGFQVIYSDTDSVMIALNKKTQKQAHDFVDKINKDLPGHMELEFEGFFPHALFVASKQSERGAKKKYALIDEKNKVKIVGFETVRRNWSKFAKAAQRTFIELIMQEKNEQALNFLRKLIKDLRAKRVPLEQMTIKMQLTRPLDSYKVLSPHVAVAKRMKKEGHPISTGMLIEYVVAEGTGLIRDKAKRLDELKKEKKSYDVDYYLNKQLLPAVEPILHVLGIPEDELFKKSSQKGLSSFG